MNNKKIDVFFAVYEVLKNDEVIRGVFDYTSEVIEYLNNKIDIKYLSTYIKNNYIIAVNSKLYRVYRFEDAED